GDARSALNTLELAASIAEADDTGTRRLTDEVVGEALQRAVRRYDKAGEEHYNLASALIKSIRNSDPDAAVYWLARMVEAGDGVPLHLRNAPTGLMKGLGYGSGYRYAHDEATGRAEGMNCLPESLAGRRYYEPGTNDPPRPDDAPDESE